MLVISRRKNESIVINDRIEVVVLEIRADRVRLGITGPADTSVRRPEIQVPPAIAEETAPGVIDEPIAASVLLAGRHVALLERLRTKAAPDCRREVVLEILLDGVAGIEDELASAASLEELKSRLHKSLDRVW